MEVTPKRKSLQIHRCGLLPGLPIVKGSREESRELFYMGESLAATLCPRSGKNPFLLRVHKVLWLSSFLIHPIVLGPQ